MGGKQVSQAKSFSALSLKGRLSQGGLSSYKFSSGESSKILNDFLWIELLIGNEKSCLYPYQIRNVRTFTRFNYEQI